MAASRLFLQFPPAIFIIISLLWHGSHCFMDMEELKSVYYGLDILKEPVSVTKEVPVGAVHVTSKYGQQYQCTFPDHSSEEKRKEEEEKIAMETGIVEMLRPMGNNACLFKAKDWWSYEFCYGKYIRQFHMEDGEMKGNIIYLGYYQEDFNWNNETARDARLKSKTGQSRYHSQTYLLGTRCDLTGQPRRAEVRFVCEENSEDYLSRVDESETCVYTVTVMTARICRHPYLKAPARRKPVSITCNPLLTEDQYNSYALEIEETKERERLAKEKRDAIVLNQVLEDEMSKTAKELLTQPLDELFPTSNKEPLGKEEFQKKFGSDETMWKSYQQRVEFRKAERERQKERLRKISDKLKTMVGKDASGEEAEKMEVKKSDDKNKEEKEKDDEDDEIISEFDDEIKEMKSKFGDSQKSVSKVKRKLALEKNLESEIENVIKEAEQEMGVKVDRSLITGLSSTLDKLVNKLHNAEKEIASADKEINKLKPENPSASTAQAVSRGGSTEEKKEEKEEKGSDEDHTEKEKKGETSKPDLPQVQQEPKKQPPQVSDMSIQAPPKTGPNPPAQDPSSRPDRPLTMEEEGAGQAPNWGDRHRGEANAGIHLPGNNNQGGLGGGSDPALAGGDDTAVPDGNAGADGDDVAVAAVGGGGGRGEDEDDLAEIKVTLRKVDNDNDDDDDDDNDGKPQLPENVQKLLEESLKKEYKKNGLQPDAQPLSFDADHSFQRERTVHVIQSEDEDGKTNRYILVFGFNSFNDEASERQRQSSLEENYGFVYKGSKSKKTIDPNL